MKTSLVGGMLGGLWLAGAVLAAEPVEASAGHVDFGKFTPPGSGGQFVEVNVRENLISMVTRLVEREEPEVAAVLQGLRSVRVNVIGLDDANRGEMERRVRAIRASLDDQGWERVVTAQQGTEDVGVYLKTRGAEAVEGIVVTVLEAGREAIFINVVGNLRPEQLALVGERFNLEPLKELDRAFPRSRP